MNTANLRASAGAVRDWWGVTLPEMESLAGALLGPREGGWVRKGLHRAIVAKHKFGAEAATLIEELAALSVDTARVRDATAQSVIVAAAFYHVRFENIHPLYDGNGRIGRLILAAQCRQSLAFPPVEFERRMQGERTAYREAFKHDGGPGTLRGMMEIVS